MSFCSTLSIQIYGALKIVSSAGGLNPQPLSYESSALTSRPQLITFFASFVIPVSLELNSDIFCLFLISLGPSVVEIFLDSRY